MRSSSIPRRRDDRRARRASGDLRPRRPRPRAAGNRGGRPGAPLPPASAIGVGAGGPRPAQARPVRFCPGGRYSTFGWTVRERIDRHGLRCDTATAKLLTGTETSWLLCTRSRHVAGPSARGRVWRMQKLASAVLVARWPCAFTRKGRRLPSALRDKSSSRLAVERTVGGHAVGVAGAHQKGHVKLSPGVARSRDTGRAMWRTAKASSVGPQLPRRQSSRGPVCW